jgi:hypothetical protein
VELHTKHQQQDKDPPSQWRCPTGRGICPCSMGRRLEAIMAGTPTASTFVVVSPTIHHGQWSGVSFKINGEERQLLSQLAKDQKSKISGLAPRYLYHRGKPKRPFETHAWDSARYTKCLSSFAIQAARHPHSLQVQTEPVRPQCLSTQCGEVARKASRHTHNF